MTRMTVLDLRSLGLMRMGAGLTLFATILARAGQIALFYSDDGYVSRSLITEKYWNPVWWSLHLFSGSSTAVGALFAVHAVAAIALAVGWKTRWSSVLCYLLTLSMYNRNPLVLDGGDRLFLLLLFWGMFLPWGQYFSLDGRWNRSKAGSTTSISVGGTGYLLQVSQVYLMAGLWKIHPVWVTELTALERALSLGQFCKPIGAWLLSFPAPVKMLTFATFLLEWVAPILLLVGNGKARAFALLGLCVFHTSIWLVFDLGFFPWISLVCLLGLIPTWIWERSDPTNEAEEFDDSKAVQVVAYMAILLTMWWNLYLAFHNTEPPDPDGPWRLPTKAASALRLAQTWNLFAPVPRTEDSRYFVEARLADGRRIDLLREGRSFPIEEPTYRYREFQNQRQRMYLTALELSVGPEFRVPFLSRLAKDWETSHPGDFIVWLRLTVERIPTRPRSPRDGRAAYELARLVPPNAGWMGPLSPDLGPLPQSPSRHPR